MTAAPPNDLNTMIVNSIDILKLDKTKITGRSGFERIEKLVEIFSGIVELTRNTGSLVKTTEQARKAFDDLLIAVLDPKETAFDLEEISRGEIAKLRAKALDVALRGFQVDPRTHNTREGFSGVIFDRVIHRIMDPKIAEETKMGYAESLMRSRLFMDYHAAELKWMLSAINVPPGNDQDGRPLTPHWAHTMATKIEGPMRPPHSYARFGNARPVAAAG